MGHFRGKSVRRLAGVGCATAAAVGLAVLAAAPATAAEGPVLGTDSATAIENSFIVVFKDGSTARPDSTAAQYGAKVEMRYTAALNGFAGTMSEQTAKRIAADPAVEFVQQNQTVSISADQPNPPSWGLDRIDQRDLPLNQNYSFATGASNVTAYIIDTGIDFDHPDFGTRATSGFDAIDGGAADDCHGHGTHVAGTVGGTSHGVAKEVRLVGVRVLSCSGGGTTAQVVAGIDWVTNNATEPAVANMSLGGGVDAAIDAATSRSIASGVTYAIASGNSNANACSFSPARVPEAITVNSSNRSDSRSSFSNWGTCTDIFAPGEGITSTWLNGGTNTISGTSMATPHVAGAAALYLSANPSASPQAVRDALVAGATPNKIPNPGTSSPNLLLYTGDGGDPDPDPTGCAAASNSTRVSIPDAGNAVTSPITISGCDGAASGTSSVAVNITHTYRGDIQIDLIAPDGTSYRLKNASSSDSADNIVTTFMANLGSEAANGTWQLSVRDVYAIDTGTLNSWTLDL
jgi:subtilisin family serine protease